MSSPPSDGQLLRFARSDPAALEALYRRHVRRLMMYAARLCDRPEDVADLVATTFVAALDSAESYDAGRGEVFPWLIGIARHLAADSARGERRERMALARVAGTRSLDEDEILELEERIDAARDHEEIDAALRHIGAADREALWLVGPLGLTRTQAAKALGISPAAFGMRLMRARRALRKRLGRLSRYPADERLPKETQP